MSTHKLGARRSSLPFGTSQNNEIPRRIFEENKKAHTWRRTLGPCSPDDLRFRLIWQHGVTFVYRLPKQRRIRQRARPLRRQGQAIKHVQQKGCPPVLSHSPWNECATAPPACMSRLLVRAVGFSRCTGHGLTSVILTISLVQIPNRITGIVFFSGFWFFFSGRWVDAMQFVFWFKTCTKWKSCRTESFVEKLVSRKADNIFKRKSQSRGHKQDWWCEIVYLCWILKWRQQYSINSFVCIVKQGWYYTLPSTGQTNKYVDMRLVFREEDQKEKGVSLISVILGIPAFALCIMTNLMQNY